MLIDAIPIIVGCYLIYICYKDYKSGSSDFVSIFFGKTVKFKYSKKSSPKKFYSLIVFYVLIGLVMILLGLYTLLNS